MRYKDDSGIDIIQIGDGGTAISTIKFNEHAPDKVVGICMFEHEDKKR